MIRRVMFSLLSLLAFFALAEGLLVALHVRPLSAERDPFRGFSERMRVFELDPVRGVFHTAPRSVIHSFNYQEFTEHKAAGGFRLFVLGGSSAYGFPWGADVAFTRVLGDALRASFPGRTIEAVNAAAMSYGSHRLRILAHELIEYEPDLLVIYEGHNEFVERRFYRQMLERKTALDPFRESLYHWRLYSGLTRLFESKRGGSESKDADAASVGQLLGLDVVREYTSDVADAERQEAAARFQENLRAILELGRSRRVPVVFCTAPSNLSGWTPNQSVFDRNAGPEVRSAVLDVLARARAALDRGEAQAAASALEGARSLAPAHAEVHFRLGQAYEALGRWDDARAAYVRARDLDGQPSRAISAINAATRSVAHEPGATLVDVEAFLEQQAPHGLMGFDLFEDYVHPKPATHQLIALALWKALLERGLLGEVRAADPSGFWPSLKASSSTGDPGSSRTKPESLNLLYNLGVVLENQGQVAQAMDKYRECLAAEERHYPARMNLGRLLHLQRRFPEAAEQYRLAAGSATDPMQRARSLVGVGQALSEMGQTDEAIRALGEATRIDPESASAWRNLGAALAATERHGEAETAFRAAVDLDPADPDVRANLGFALLLQGKLDAADREFRTVLDQRPEHRRSANGRAAVLTEQGRYDEAERIFLDSVRLDPQDRFARGGLELIQQRRGTGGRPRH